MGRNHSLGHAAVAYKSKAFMESLTARPLRIMAEYFDPRTRLREQNVGDAIVIFGSARILPRNTALARLKRAKRPTRGRISPRQKQKIREAFRLVEMSRYYEDARELARRITEWSLTLGDNPRRFVVCSGGGPGIMEAANRGAADAGGKSIGLGIQLPHEQLPNRYISPEMNFNFHYFFMRKLWFSQLAKALIVFPGGFGTMDELWEMLTLMQTGKLHHGNPILIYGRRFWDDVLDWRALVRWGVISEADYGLLQFADNVDDAFNQVQARLEKHHLLLDRGWPW
jgi:uncharacterized protein (TIGR00730 family)